MYHIIGLEMYYTIIYYSNQHSILYRKYVYLTAGISMFKISSLSWQEETNKPCHENFFNKNFKRNKYWHVLQDFYFLNLRL